MALDAQRNWDASMAENLNRTMMQSDNPNLELTSATSGEANGRPLVTQQLRREPWDSEPIYLPDELIILIIEHVSESALAQKTLASCCLLSRQWWRASVAYLYEWPEVEGGRFQPFLESVCPSVHEKTRESRTARYIRTLDLSRLVHEARSSLTARLLGRVKYQLKGFIAPQATFNSACLAPLGKSKYLEVLDLSLVSQPPPLQELFKHISNLHELTDLRLPRSAGFGGGELRPETFKWPPNLRNLHLSGGIDLNFSDGTVAFPQTLHRLSIEHCPKARGPVMMRFLRTAVRPLRNLKSISLAHLPQVEHNDLSDLLAVLPYIPKISISLDYITSHFFDYDSACLREYVVNPGLAGMEAWPTTYEDSTNTFDLSSLPFDRPPHSHLQILELTNSGNWDSSIDERIDPVDIIVALEEGVFPLLRQVRVARSLNWQDGETGRELDALADALVANEATWRIAEEERRREEQFQNRLGNSDDHLHEIEAHIQRDLKTGIWLIDG